MRVTLPGCCRRRAVSVAFAVSCLIGLVGCDGLVALDGWVRAGKGTSSTFSPVDSEPDQPENVLGGVTVELWGLDGSKKSTWHTHSGNDLEGSFSVSYTGPDAYDYGVKYKLRAHAEAYKPLDTEVVLKRYGPCYGIIMLVPEHVED